MRQNAGFCTTSPNATQDVNGTVQIGSSGKVFAEIREVTGTTGATGHITNVSYPSGYTMTNTRILSIEINNAGVYWSTLGMYYTGESVIVRCSMSASNIAIYYPDVSSYHSKDFRMLVMKVL